MSIYLASLNPAIDVKHVSGGIIFSSDKISLDVSCEVAPEGYKVNYNFSPSVYESVIYGSVKELTDSLSPYVNDFFKTMAKKVDKNEYF